MFRHPSSSYQRALYLLAFHADQPDNMQGDFELTNFQDGCLPAAFMVGLLVACPVFVHLAKSVQTFKLVGIGLLIWFVSVFAAGLSWDFWSLLFCRTAVGAGEASFVILAAPFIGAASYLFTRLLLTCNNRKTQSAIFFTLLNVKITALSFGWQRRSSASLTEQHGRMAVVDAISKRGLL